MRARVPWMCLFGSWIFACQSQPPSTNAVATPPTSSTAQASTQTSTSTQPSTQPSTSTPPQTSTPTQASPPPVGYVQSTHIPISGHDRTYAMYVPASYDAAKAYPIIAVLHGDGGTGALMRGAFGLEAAAADGAIFVYPDGTNHTWKQADKAETNEDFFFFDAMIARTSDRYRVDSKRIFVTGFSSGAYMTNQLGCFRGGTIRAIAPMSGGGPYDAVGGHYDAQGNLQCNGKPVAALMIHGDVDNTVPINEGQKSLSHWSSVNQCTQPFPQDGSDACKTTACAQPVTFCTVHGKGHQIWAEAPTRVWQFFSSFR